MAKYISAQELAERLGVSGPTIRRMMVDGEFPIGTYYVSGRTSRFDGDAIENYLLSVAPKRAQNMRTSAHNADQLELPLQQEDDLYE